MKKYDIKTTDEQTLRKWYHLMTLGRALDEKAPAYLLQSLGWSYHAPYAGHDGIQLAIGQVFTLGEDYLFPYYRDMLTVLSAGMTPEELILNGISKATDPGSAGRHMSNHFAKPEWHIENISSATGTHDLHAAGVGRAMVYYGHKGVAITSHGESATSEGFVYEAINGASNERLPVILYSRTTVMAFPSLKRIRLPIVKWPITSPVLRTSASFIAMERMYLTR